MSDARLRELERRWRQTDAVDDEVAFLLERLRVGDLTEERARLAAWLGHPAAERVMGAGFEPRDRARDALAGHAQSPELIQAALARWGDGLVEFGLEVARRAALADMRRCVTTLAANARTDPEESPEVKEARAVLVRNLSTVVDVSVAHAVDPANARRQEEWRRWGAYLMSEPYHELRPQAGEGLQACLDHERANVFNNFDFVNSNTRVRWWHQVRPREDVDAAARYHAIRTAVRAEVVPWVLGWLDPLRDLEARALASLLDDPLDDLEVASPCEVEWGSMRPLDPAGRARACATCERNVYDLSALTRDDAAALLRAHEDERLCVRFLRREDGRILTLDCTSGLSIRLVRASSGLRPRPTMGIRLPTRR